MRPAILRFAFVAALLGGVACSRAIQAGDVGPPVLVFTNESVDMTTVYAIRPGGQAVRLASVMPGRTDTLSLPGSIANASQVTIIASPLAGTSVASSGPISIGPGTRLVITLSSSQNILRVLPASPP